MMAKFDELRSVFYNYEVGYLEGLKFALLVLTGVADSILQQIEQQQKKVEEEE